MAERRWELVVRDARGRRRRGTVTWCEHAPASLDAPSPPAEFAILLLARQSEVRGAPPATAICVPGTPPIRAMGAAPAKHLPAKIADLTMPPQRMAEFGAGRIVMQAPGLIEPTDVFPLHSDRPRLDRLALALLEAAETESMAPYTVLIRRELHLPAGTDAFAALKAHLSPADPEQRPPPRAPAIARLGKALRQLQAGRAPDGSFDVLAADLRFLRLFDGRETWSPAALDRLLADVRAEPDTRSAQRRRPAHRRRAKVVPLRPGRAGDEPAEDA